MYCNDSWLTFWRDEHRVMIREKQRHITQKDYCKNTKQRRSCRRSFILTAGEIPTITYNIDTQIAYAVDNFRGIAYAARKRLKFRKTKKEKLSAWHNKNLHRE